MAEPTIERRELTVMQRPARVHVGGAGSALLLIHGAWGRAAMHWSRVWGALARRHRVVAPELPGLGDPEVPAPASVRGYVAWLSALLDQLGVDRAVCVGNSFGASVVWSLAGRAPERCAGLVLVNGVPMPATPPLLAFVGATRWGQALMRALLRRLAYHPGALKKAFVDLQAAPVDALRPLLAARGAELVPRLAELLIAGDGPPEPRVAPLLLWGAEDRLIGTGARDARALHARLARSELALIPGAGHFPQLEAPDVFVETLERFVARQAPPAR